MNHYAKSVSRTWGDISTRLHNVRLHIIAWAAFIAYEVSIVRLITGQFASFGDYVIHYLLNIIFFYFHSHYALPLALNKPKRIFNWRLPLVFVLETAGYLLLSFVSEWVTIRLTSIQIADPISLNYTSMIGAVWRVIYIGGFSTAYYLFMSNIKERRKSELLEQERLQEIIQKQIVEKNLAHAESAFLKAQINPHFLFNTLNFIYARTRRTSPVAAQAIIILAEMMRFASSFDMQHDFLKLKIEIAQVENLILLHQIREDHKLEIDLIVQEGIDEVRIIPFVVMTLGENMFKHGNLNVESFIKIYVENNYIYITTENEILSVQNVSGLHSGLDNIRKRLILAYDEDYEFQVGTIDSKFKTHIKIPVR